MKSLADRTSVDEIQSRLMRLAALSFLACVSSPSPPAVLSFGTWPAAVVAAATELIRKGTSAMGVKSVSVPNRSTKSPARTLGRQALALGPEVIVRC